MKLRPYQRDAYDATLAALQRTRRVLVVKATGLGKTVLFCHLASAPGCDRTLILAHREELVRQAAAKAEAISGEPVGIEMADDRVSEHMGRPPRIVVASVQTLCRRFAKFDPKCIWRVVVDEAHHAVAGTYTTIIDHFLSGNPNSHLIGVTATPQRGDKLALGQVFEECCYEYYLPQAIADGWLVDVDQRVVRVEGLDFSNVRKTAGDMNEGDLENILKEEKVLHQMAIPTLECAEGRPGLIFCVSVHHAHLMADVLNRYKPNCAKALDGTTPKDRRRDEISRYCNGEIQFLCNCGIFLEGFDAPATSVIAMGRPTTSIGLYSQVLGRGTRPLPGVVDAFANGTAEDRRNAIQRSPKPRMLMLDFAGNAGKHKIVTAVDVLGGVYADDVRELAIKLSEESPTTVRTKEQLELAAVLLEGKKLSAEFHRLEAEKKRARERERIKADVEYSTQTVSPFRRSDLVPREERESVVKHGGPSEKQVSYLLNLGVSMDKIRTYSKRQAGVVIDSLVEKRNAAKNQGLRVVG